MFTLEVTLQDGSIDKIDLAQGWAVLPLTSIGVHVYPATATGPWVVRVSNGTLPNPPGAIYYKSIKLKHTSLQFMVLPHYGGGPSGGQELVLVSEGQHLLRPRQIIERRFSLYNGPAGRGAAAKPLYYLDLPIPAVVDNYGPTKSKMPPVNRDYYKSLYRGQSAALMTAMSNGTPFYLDNMAKISRVGPYIYDGHPLGYDPGGYGIDSTLAGYEQCSEAILFKSIVHEAVMARMFIAAYDRITGMPAVGPYDVIYTGPRQWHQEMVAFLEGPLYQKKYKVFNAGTCPYEVPLWEIDKHDSGHLSRAGRYPIALKEYANDEAAADDLWMITEDAKVAIGNNMDRYWAWPVIHAVACAKYGKGNQTAWLGQQKIRAQVAADSYGICNHVNDPNGMPPGYLGCMTFHEGLVLIARFCLGGDSNLLKTCQTLYNTLPPQPYYGVIGPNHWTCTTPNLSGFGDGDPSHVYAALALAYRFTQNPVLLEIARKQWVPHTSNQEMLIWLQSLTAMDKAWGCEMEAVLGGL